MGRWADERKIVAVTLSWESADLLPRFVESTMRWADHLVIVDTGSKDGSMDLLWRLDRPNVHVFYNETTAATFNRGECLNVALAQVERLMLNPYWLAVVDCDEMFEDGFAELCAPVLRHLPKVYNQVSFRRPNLWYSETMVRDDGIHSTYREAAFQRWRPRMRYPAKVFHMKRVLHRRPITFNSRAYLLHYELRSVERSRLQYERLKAIDREWDMLLRDPADPPALAELVPLAQRGGDRRPSRLKVARDVAGAMGGLTLRKVRSRLRSRR